MNISIISLWFPLLGNNIVDFKVLSTVDKRLFNYTNVNTAVGKSAQIHFSSVRDSCLSFKNMCFKNDIVFRKQEIITFFMLT